MKRIPFLLLMVVFLQAAVPAFSAETREQLIEAQNTAIAATPNNPALYNERAYLYILEGKYDQALDDYNKALSLDPANADVLYNRGLYYEMQTSEYDKAINDFEQALEVDSGIAEAYLEIAKCYTMEEKGAKAIENYSKYIEAVPDDPQGYYGRAIAYFYHGQYGPAWDDIHMTEKLGGKVYDTFLNKLKKASKRDK